VGCTAEPRESVKVNSKKRSLSQPGFQANSITLNCQRRAQAFQFALYRENELPKLTESIMKLVPNPVALRNEDDYETDEEMLTKA
jgi:hypothetical protein